MLSRTVAVCVLALTVLAVTAGAASAQGYNAGAYQTNTNGGAGATLQFTNLNTSNNSSEHSLTHLWVSNSCLSCNPLYWVEAGAVIGRTEYNDYTAPTYDWVNQNVNGYFEHHWGSAPYNNYFTVQILYAGGGNWYVNDAGNTATATNASFSSSTFDYAFGETTDTSGGGKVCTHDSSLTWYGTSGVGHSGFSSLAQNGAGLIAANWTSQPTAARAYADEPSNC